MSKHILDRNIKITQRRYMTLLRQRDALLEACKRSLRLLDGIIGKEATAELTTTIIMKKVIKDCEEK